jgi:hypothetical protein
MADLNAALQLIQKDLQLTSSLINDGVTTLDALKKYLSSVVSELLDKDFERLLLAMYRIDIPEHRFKKALNAEDPNEIPDKIAALIIERELLKISYRKKYSN